VDARSEAEELVGLWQDLQEAQVAGDAQRLAWLRQRAEAETRHEDASPEWQLLADDAGRHLDRLQEELAAQPSAGVGGDTVVLDAESTPEPVEGRGRGKGSWIWLAIVAGWILLQVFQAIGGGDGSP
jgi:hypothetical protein